MRLGLFGGTFDPIHQGHLRVARAALSQCTLDKVFFIPAFLSPHKQDRCPAATAEDRLEMLRLALDGQKEFEVSTVEINRHRVSFTAETLRDLRGLYPGDDFFLILGEDAYAAFDSWRESEFIREQAQILVAPRSSKISFRVAASKFLECAKLKMPHTPESSEQIRSDLWQGKTESLCFLPESVADYIQRRSIYG